jgi:hypothetical protein
MSNRQEPSGEFRKGLSTKVHEAGVVTLGLLIGAALTYALAQAVLPSLHVGNPNFYGFLFGLSSNLLVAVILYYFLERGIRSINEVTIMPNLDLRGVVKKVENSSHQVRILETWTTLVNNDVYYQPFVAAVVRAANRGATIYILLIHPDSEGARQRERQLKGVIDVRGQIRRSLARLYTQQSEGAFRDLKDSLQVRIYNALPPAIIYACDGTCYATLFPIDRITSQRPNLEVNMASRFGGFIEEKFRELWQGAENAQPIALREHMMLRIVAPQRLSEFYYAPAADDASWFISDDDADAVVRISKEERVTVTFDGRVFDAKPALVLDPERASALDLLATRYDWSADQVRDKLQKGPVVVRLSPIEADDDDTQSATIA